MGRIADALRRAARDGGTTDRSSTAETAPEPLATAAAPAFPTGSSPLDLTRLTRLVEALDRSTIELHEALSTIETAINDLNAGVEVWVVDHPLRESTVEPESPTEMSVYEVRELGYCAWDDCWGLGVRAVRCTEGATSAHVSRTVMSRRPLTLCDRNEQLSAADLLPHVVERMAEQVAESIARIERVKQTADSIVRVAAAPPKPADTPTTWEIL